MIANTKYNEIAYARQIMENGFQSKYYGYELRLLAVYMRDVLGKSPEEIRCSLIAFCETYYPHYTYAAVYKLVNKAVAISKNQENILIDIPEIEITEAEYNRIVGYGLNDKLTIVLFSLLVRKKLSRKMYEAKNKQESESLFLQLSDEVLSDIRRMSGIGSKKLLVGMLWTLNRKGAVSTYNNALIRLEFMAGIEPSDGLLAIRNYDDTSLYFRRFWGDWKIRSCKKCGDPFYAKNNRQLFCERHQGYDPVLFKQVQCEKCKKRITVSSMGNSSHLCADCIRDEK